MLEKMSIEDIENLKIEDVKRFEKEGRAEKINIKGHDCYLVNLGGHFKYSILVFKNNKHIYYANDYQLHHQTKIKEELKNYYIQVLNNKLFTESELMEEIQDYNEYKNKDYYIRNYWPMQFKRISVFYIGERSKEQAEAIKTMIYCPPCFSYVNDPEIVEKAYKFINHIEKSYQKAAEDLEVFKKMISYELANHEACVSRDYTSTLDSLGLKFEELTEEQQEIVKKELNRQIETFIY